VPLAPAWDRDRMGLDLTMLNGLKAAGVRMGRTGREAQRASG
jgi:hypothetical protein